MYRTIPDRSRPPRGRPCRRRSRPLAVAALVALVFPGWLSAGRGAKREERPRTAAELQVVDCLLPGQVRKLGRRQTYLTQRRPVRTTALDCEIRGGEYVAYDRASYDTALRVWLAAAEAGDPQAQYYVGEIHEKGLGRPPDYAEAARWYRRAAEQGYGPAQTNLGFLLEQGLGVERDPRAALEWYRKASGVPGVILLDSELEAIRKELAEAHAGLERAESEAAGLTRELAARRDELEAERSSGRRSSEKVATLEARVAALTADLDAREQEAARLRETQQRYDVAGPSIEIIDTAAVRGSGAGGQEDPGLVGRVEAPAGLAEFQADGERVQVGEDGFFRLAGGSDQRIVFVAIDLQGKRAELVFEPGGPTLGGVEATRPAAPSGRGVKFGRYHALIIGNDTYRHLPSLKTPTTDARALGELLERRYGFRTRLLLDATYVDVLGALGALREELTDKDNLLIYYAGHGEIDPVTGVGYWQLVDAEPETRINWMSSREISEQLSLLPAKHVLVVADSCYSGALTRSSLARLEGASDEERDRWLRKITDQRSRTALTSGDIRPVLDSGGSGHSIFARVLLDVLGQNSEVLETQRLWAAVRVRVEYRAKAAGREQVPQYAPIRHAGHETGEFFFVPLTG